MPDLILDLPGGKPSISREWCMPNRWTFEMRPVAGFLDRWLVGRGVIVDPFCGRSSRATLSNDIGCGTDAVTWLREHEGIRADAVLLDPPYSPRQVAECYRNAGMPVSQTTTQTALLYRVCKELLADMLAPGGIALTFGWNSTGFGINRGFTQREILLVCHGAAHNDTICVAETKDTPA